MKKIIQSIVLVLVTLSAFNSLAQTTIVGGPVTPVIDSEQAARAFLFFSRTKQFSGQSEFQKPDGSWSPATYFTMNRAGDIIQLNVNGIEIKIPSDKPLKGLPFEAGSSLQNFNLWLSAYDYSMQQKANGYFNAPILTTSSVIGVLLNPGQIQKFVPYTPAFGVDQKSLRLKLDNGNISAYDSYRGGFIVSLDPLSSEQNYVIYQNNPYDEIFVGIIGPNTAPVAANQKAVNTTLAGNVVDADFPYDDASQTFGDYVWFQDMKVDGTRVSDTGNTPEKVFTTDLNGDGGLIVYIDDPNARILVKQWSENGPITLLETKVLASSQYGFSVYTATQGLGKLMVVVLSPNTGTFNIQLQRYRGSPFNGPTKGSVPQAPVDK